MRLQLLFVAVCWANAFLSTMSVAGSSDYCMSVQSYLDGEFIRERPEVFSGLVFDVSVTMDQHAFDGSKGCSIRLGRDPHPTEMAVRWSDCERDARVIEGTLLTAGGLHPWPYQAVIEVRFFYSKESRQISSCKLTVNRVVSIKIEDL